MLFLSVYTSQSTKGLQSPRYSVLPWNNRFPQEYYFLSERHHKKNSLIIQHNMLNTANDQWTQAQEVHQVKNSPLPYGCLAFLMFFSFFNSIFESIPYLYILQFRLKLKIFLDQTEDSSEGKTGRRQPFRLYTPELSLPHNCDKLFLCPDLHH